MTCQHTIDLAAYVLDALEPAEAEELRLHLLDCTDCLPEYEELRGLPTVLRRLAPSDVDEIITPAELPNGLCEELLARASVRRQRHTRRRVFSLAATAAAVAAGFVTGVAVPLHHAPATTSVVVAATNPHTWVGASITLTSQSWGTQIWLKLSGVTWNQQCMLVVTAADGRRDVAASWVATYKGSFNVTGTTAIPVGQIRHLDVITTTGKRLVSVPPPVHLPG
jgi:hypothetical protein